MRSLHFRLRHFREINASALCFIALNLQVFGWVQSKFKVKEEEKKKKKNKSFETGSSSAPLYPQRFEAQKEEFNDWPVGLLSIGTFGKNELQETPQMPEMAGFYQFLEDVEDFTIEEVIKLQKELIKLLKQKPKTSTDGSETGMERANLPLNRFLNCPSSLEVDRGTSLRLSDGIDNGAIADNLSPDSKIILRKAREILSNNCNTIKRKSISLLLKKMFVCKGGFSPNLSLRDQMPESRLEKLLRNILHKKINQQNSDQMSSVKKYLADKSPDRKNVKDGSRESEENRCKWVKTDSNFIVLEMKHPALKE